MSEFKIFHYHVTTEKLPAGMRELTFVLLSDLHNHTYGPDNGRLLAAIGVQKPDAVMVAGDLLTARLGQSFAPALALIRDVRALGIPIFYGNGNHEYRLRLHPENYGNMYADYSRGLREAGATLLENARAAFEVDGFPMMVYGFELDSRFYRKWTKEKLEKQELEKALGRPEPEFYSILLAHNPVYFDSYAAWGADLCLSGHLHGGIIRIPGVGGVITPQARLFPKYDAGHFTKAESELVVSRGLGTHTVNIRIFNPPELAVIHLGRRTREYGHSR